MQQKLRRGGVRPCNTFRHAHIEKLKKELRLHLISAYCLGAALALSGPNWERIGAVMLAAVYRHGAMDKWDIHKQDMAWSAKTSEQLSAGAVYFKLLNFSRGDLARRNSSIANLAPNELGKRALRIYNAEVIEKTYGRFKHFRSLVLYRTHDLGRYMLYEKKLLPVDPRRYRWTKHFRKGKYVSIHAYDKATGEHRFTLTLNDCRLFVADPIPGAAHVFSVRLDTSEMETLKTEFRAVCDRHPDCVRFAKCTRRD